MTGCDEHQGAGEKSGVLVNARTGDTVARDVEMAATRASRRRGLLGRDAMDAASALVLAPCCAIHTAHMRFAIDVMFVNREGRVLKIAARMVPWRIAIAPRACAAVEMSAGSAAAHAVEVGDYLSVRSADGAASTAPFGGKVHSDIVGVSRVGS
jgi:uncharacterized protein